MKTKISLIVQLQPWIKKFILGIDHLESRTCKGYEKAIHMFVIYMDKNLKNRVFPLIVNQEIISGWLKESRTYYSFHTILSWARIISRFFSFLECNGILKKNILNHLQDTYSKRGFTGIVVSLMSTSPKQSLQTLKPQESFTSPLGKQMLKFIRLGRAQGMIYRNEEDILCRFDRFIGSYKYPPKRLSESVIKKWLNLFPHSQSGNRYINYGVIRRFCFYLSRFDSHAYIPDSSLVHTPHLSIPHIYSRDDIKAILKATRMLKSSTLSPLRPQTYSVLFLLLYTTGMRISEALKLRINDIDFENQALIIRETKFYKSRLVPLSSGMMKELEDYLQLRVKVRIPTMPESPIFQNPHRKGHYSKSAVRTTFSKILRKIGIQKMEGYRPPCIHGLRHAIATHRLELWYKNGEDIQNKIGILSTYLGHKGISSTQRYLTMTLELLQSASKQYNHYFHQSTNTKGGSKNEKK